MEYAHHAADYGVKIENAAPDFDAIIARSRGVADKMSKGIQYLFKKNNITVIEGHGKLTAEKTVEVTNAAGEKTIFEAQHIVLATAPVPVSYRISLRMENGLSVTVRP